MANHLKLLVVDDDAAICQACRRVFTRQGFEVEQCTDARQGLRRATAEDYAAILLDIKMPEMDGIQFLAELRSEKPTVPVILITGYPNVPSAASAVRLGASDYVTKPFTPAQITQSVQRVLPRRPAKTVVQDGSASRKAEPWLPRAGEFRFLDQSWLQLGREGWGRAGAMHQRMPSVPMPFEGSVRVGAVLSRPQTTSAKAIHLPQSAEVVYQGLPLAALTMTDGLRVIVPSPVSGVVVSVNDLLGRDPSRLLTDPCGKGWIACVWTTRFEEEIDRCRPRRVILANARPSSAAGQSEHLTSLGCQVEIVRDDDALALAICDAAHRVLLLDAASFADLGPELVRRVNAAAPSLRVVVLGPSDSPWEAAYREHKIFYYAVEPFADNEIVEILNAVFRSPDPSLRQPECPKASFTPISGIGVTYRHGGTAQLLAEPGLLSESEGLGAQIVQRLTDQAARLRTTRGAEPLAPAAVSNAAGTYDRVVVLSARDTGRLPGTLAQDTAAGPVSAASEAARNVAALVVQPGPNGHGLAGLDERTIAFLAEHIVQELGSG
jgi:DNA-binding response OmpR family regulator